jgi:hypothetical protein
MSTKAQSVLDTDDLNDTDEAILELMRDGRVTPPLVAKKLQKSREYASERLIRMKEHGNATRIAPGLYELVNDPRRPDTVRAGGDAGGRMSEGDLFEDGELDEGEN